MTRLSQRGPCCMIRETKNIPNKTNKVSGTAAIIRGMRIQRRFVRIAPTMHAVETAAAKAVRRIAVRASGTMNIAFSLRDAEGQHRAVPLISLLFHSPLSNVTDISFMGCWLISFIIPGANFVNSFMNSLVSIPREAASALIKSSCSCGNDGALGSRDSAAASLLIVLESLVLASPVR